MAADAIIFDGETNATVPAFIRLVRQKALAEGRERDDQWMAAFASSCIDGSALEWYETLDEEVQESWKLLRAALLSRWSRSESISSTGPVLTPPPGMPTPAAAPPSLPDLNMPAIPRSGALPPRSLGKVGRVRVRATSGETIGYLANSCSAEGKAWVTLKESEAMVVQVMPSRLETGFAHEIKAVGRDDVRIGVFYSTNSGELSRRNVAIEEGSVWTFNLFHVRPDGRSPTGWRSASSTERRPALFAYSVTKSLVPLWKSPGGAFYEFHVMLANDPKDNVDGPVFVVSRATTRQLMPDRGDNLVEVVMTLEPSH